MIEKIINTIVKAYRNYTGLDEIKRGLNIACEISGIDFTDKEKSEMLTTILYRLSQEGRP